MHTVNKHIEKWPSWPTSCRWHLQSIFFIKEGCIWTKISLEFAPNSPIAKKSVLVQVMSEPLLTNMHDVIWRHWLGSSDSVLQLHEQIKLQKVTAQFEKNIISQFQILIHISTSTLSTDSTERNVFLFFFVPFQNIKSEAAIVTAQFEKISFHNSRYSFTFQHQHSRRIQRNVMFFVLFLFLFKI